jgi:hypothetical protein
MGAVGVAVAAAAIVGVPLAADPAVTILRRDGELWAHGEDSIASVQAGWIQGGPHLLVSGTSMTILTVDARLMATLPTIIRPGATRTLVIAFGMGSSFRHGLILGMAEVTGVELVPTVPTFFHNFFADGERVLADPAGRVVIGDGRNHVELVDDAYDIVIVDPPPPMRTAGAGVLYSAEFYQAIARRLGPQGVLAQWVPYDETIDDFRAHVRTFRSVFPEVVLIQSVGGFGVHMFGSTAPIALDEDRIRTVLARPGVVDDLSAAVDAPVAGLEDWVATIEGLPIARGREVEWIAGDGPTISDDRPRTEYLLLRRLFGPDSVPMVPRSVATLFEEAGVGVAISSAP